jgi:bacteriocin biosynthesis cyclodehydratase domain-containing protein
MSPGAKIVNLAVSGALAGEATNALRQALADAGYAIADEPAHDMASEEPGVDQGEAGMVVGVLVADHDDPVVADLTAMWHAAGIPSLVTVQQHPDVRIGPLDIPGTDLCATCFTTRIRQHDPIPAPRDKKSAEPAERGAATSVDGFPPYLVAMVVSLIVDRLGALDDKAAERQNEITVVNTATLVTRTHPVIPVNLCPQCSDQRPIGVLSGGDPMFPDLSGVPR